MPPVKRKVSKQKSARKGSAARKTTAARQSGAGRKSGKSRWSAQVMRHSDALDLEPSVFKSGSAVHIARSLKRSAERSTRRKGTPFQSAMSMLNFFINRGGAGLGSRRKAVLEQAKTELRKAFHRDA
jgi:hypothetical protein